MCVTYKEKLLEKTSCDSCGEDLLIGQEVVKDMHPECIYTFCNNDCLNNPHGDYI